jgi:hypothetical protein
MITCQTTKYLRYISTTSSVARMALIGACAATDKKAYATHIWDRTYFLHHRFPLLKGLQLILHLLIVSFYDKTRAKP